jgi:hypothetical protein
MDRELAGREGAKLRHLDTASRIRAWATGAKPAARRGAIGDGGSPTGTVSVRAARLDDADDTRDRARPFPRTRLCGTKRRHKITRFSRTMLN